MSPAAASFVVDAVRTPFGRHGGALAGVRPDDLAATALRGLLDRHPGLDLARIDDIWFGDANAAGEDNRNVARMATLLAGLPTSVPGSTVNRLCGSGLEAVIGASRAVAVGDASITVAGGVESMSRAPWVVLKPDAAYARGHQQMWSTTIGWRMVNPTMPKLWTVALGEGAEILADRYAITREAQDEFAVASHHNAARAWDAGAYADEVVAVDGVDLDRDESIRADSSVE
jgi:acetyl-CoA acetyltransferase family protein